MTLWWIGDFVLLLVVAPIVAILLGGVLTEARAIVPSVYKIRDAARRGSSDLDAVPLLLTTQDQGDQDGRGRRRLRRLTRRDRGRRVRRSE